MKRIFSLLKACLSNNMSLFKIKTKSKSKLLKRLIPIIIFIFVFISIYYYANILVEQLIKVKLEYMVLSLFTFLTFILTLIEGIYKSGNLLFNCKDDNLLLSLPIKRHTVIFIRVFKFYIFELLYNSLFLLPVIFAYALNVKVELEYYVISFFMVLLLPVIPIFISCIIGSFISFTSSKFKFKNIVQIIITTLFLVFMIYISYNIEGITNTIATNATNINGFVTKLYYPALVYSELIINFNILKLLVFIIINICLFLILIIILGKFYFKINSKVKEIKINKNNKRYLVKVRKPFVSLVKKEIKKFINTPVFVINAGFGLVLFVAICILIVIKFDMFASLIKNYGFNMSLKTMKDYTPLVLFGLISFASFMTSITSSMISLEGSNFSILKSLPVRPIKIILSKVVAAIIIMLPFIIVGDIIIFIKFSFNIINIIMILILSIILPLVSEMIGIIINLKYPKLNAESDTEVVKQSTSSMIAVFVGFIFAALNIFIIIKSIDINISSYVILLCSIVIYIFISIIMYVYLNKKGVKDFKDINV